MITIDCYSQEQKVDGIKLELNEKMDGITAMLAKMASMMEKGGQGRMRTGKGYVGVAAGVRHTVVIPFAVGIPVDSEVRSRVRISRIGERLTRGFPPCDVLEGRSLRMSRYEDGLVVDAEDERKKKRCCCWDLQHFIFF